jgi:hypothetical protein
MERFRPRPSGRLAETLPTLPGGRRGSSDPRCEDTSAGGSPPPGEHLDTGFEPEVTGWSRSARRRQKPGRPARRVRRTVGAEPTPNRQQCGGLRPRAGGLTSAARSGERRAGPASRGCCSEGSPPPGYLAPAGGERRAELGSNDVSFYSFQAFRHSLSPMNPYEAGMQTNKKRLWMDVIGLRR